jgi:methionyl-tRNA formyltransferase
MRVVFAGTPEFAATALAALLESRHELACVYTQPDRPSGRGRKLKASAVKNLAERSAVPLRQPASLRPPEVRQELAALEPDVLVVAAYGLLLPAGILATPAAGCINVHASLLPRWRGAAPVQRAILAGDRETGVSIMQMDEGLDTGDVLCAARCEIRSDDTAGSLHDRLARLGAETLLETLESVSEGRQKPVPQDEALATYAPRIEKPEARLDWRLDAETLERQVRAFNPWPVAFTELPGAPSAAGPRLRVWRARVGSDEAAGATPGAVIFTGAEGIGVATGRGVLILDEVQVPGSRVMSVADFLNARPLENHTLLGAL